MTPTRQRPASAKKLRPNSSTSKQAASHRQMLKVLGAPFGSQLVQGGFGTWLLDNDRMQPWIKAGTVRSHHTGSNKNDPVAGVFAMGQMMQDGKFRIPYATASDQEKAEEFISELLVFPKSTGDVVMAMWLAQVPMRVGSAALRSWFTPGGRGHMVANPSYYR